MSKADITYGSHLLRDLWLCVPVVLWYFGMDTQLALGRQMLVMSIFVLSLQFVVGVGGIVTLGHALYFGLGGYAAGFAAIYWTQAPIVGLIVGIAVGGSAGLASGALILRRKSLTLVVLTMLLPLIAMELFNRLGAITGGFDGLQGIEIGPLLGTWDFDLQGKVAFVYASGVLAVAWIILKIVGVSPFGRLLNAGRLNGTRVRAYGVSLYTSRIVALGIGGAIAGAAGALSAQTNAFIALDAFSFELSGTALVMAIIGGLGSLYGALVGVVLYKLLEHMIGLADPVYWLFWVGVGLVGIVVFAPEGLTGLMQRRYSTPEAHRGDGDAP